MNAEMQKTAVEYRLSIIGSEVDIVISIQHYNDRPKHTIKIYWNIPNR